MRVEDWRKKELEKLYINVIIIEDLSEQITLLYAKGNSMRDIKGYIKRNIWNENKWRIYKLSNKYGKWRSKKEAVYVALGIDITGKKEIIGFWEGLS